MSVQITLQIEAGTARHLQGLSPPTPDAEVLRQIETQFGITLSPMHPGVDDPTLTSFFTVDIDEPEVAHEVLDQLRESPAVESAYIKPPDEMP